MLTSPRRPTIWVVALSFAGLCVTALVFMLTRDVIWSLVVLLLTFTAVRRVLQRR